MHRSTLLVLAVSLLLAAPLASHGKRCNRACQCRRTCAPAVATCGTHGRKAKVCRTRVLRACNRRGLQACEVAPTPTTTTLPQGPVCKAYMSVCTPDPTWQAFEASGGGCCIIDGCRGVTYFDTPTQIAGVYRAGDGRLSGDRSATGDDGDVYLNCTAQGDSLLPTQYSWIFQKGSADAFTAMPDGSIVMSGPMFNRPDGGPGFSGDTPPYWLPLGFSATLSKVCAQQQSVIAEAAVSFKKEDGSVCAITGYFTGLRHVGQ
jgi:hypothetical protein